MNCHIEAVEKNKFFDSSSFNTFHSLPMYQPSPSPTHLYLRIFAWVHFRISLCELNQLYTCATHP